MKRVWLLAGFTAAAIAGLGILGQRPADRAAHADHETVEAWRFKQGRGVELSPSARERLGVRIAGAAIEDLVPSREGVPCRIFRTGTESGDGVTAAASLWMPTEESRLLALGQAVTLRRDSDAWTGRVDSIEPPLMKYSSEVEVLLSVRDAAGRLRVGDFVLAELEEGKGRRSRVLTVPESALVESVRGGFVYVVNGGAFLRTPVRTGARQGGKVEITDGLFEGDEIVTSGAPGLWMVELQAVNGGKGCADGH